MDTTRLLALMKQNKEDASEYIGNVENNYAPLQVRTFLETLGGKDSPITWDNLNDKEKQLLKDTILDARFKRAEDLFYTKDAVELAKKEKDAVAQEQLQKFLDQRPYFDTRAGSVTYEDYRDSSDGIQGMSDLNVFPEAAIRNTLGRFTYKTMPDGSVKVIDEPYDFYNDDPGGLTPEQVQTSRYEKMPTPEKLQTLAKESFAPEGFRTLPSRVGNAFIGSKGRPINITIPPKQLNLRTVEELGPEIIDGQQIKPVVKELTLQEKVRALLDKYRNVR